MSQYQVIYMKDGVLYVSTTLAHSMSDASDNVTRTVDGDITITGVMLYRTSQEIEDDTKYNGGL